MADTKNYGLKGVGDDVQFGKAGGRFVFNTGAVDFRATDSGGSTLVHLQVLSPVGDTDAATKLYVDDVAAGLDFKESVTCATTADMGATYAAGGGAAGNGQFTSVPATIDGVTLVTGDRVLVKNETTPTENGIYVVTATTTIIDRATDHDSDAEVSAGNFTFVEEGTVNADTGWVLQGPDPLVINTDNLDWVLFSTSGTLIAGTGLVKSGNVLDLDFSELTSASVIALSDELIFQDGGVESRITVTNFLADRDIVTITTNGIVTRTANDTYAARTITASSTATEEGLIVVNGDGVSGNPTIGLDIQGTTSASTNAANTDELILFDGTNNRAYSITELSNAPAFGGSASSISDGNSSVAVVDAGAGTITTNIDATDIIVSILGSTTFSHFIEIGVDSATTNADIPVIRISATSTGTPASGIGPSIEFESETTAGGPGNQEVGGLFALAATDVTGGSEDFDFVFQLMAGGSPAAEVARITSTGNLTLSGTVDGIDIATDVAANTAKVTNATHTGQVVGSGALTLNSDATAITDQPATGAIIAADTILINDGGVLSEATFTQMDTYFDSSLNFGSGDGTVTSSGSPLNNEVAVFATGTDINSDSTFTWNGTTLNVTGVITIDELSFDGDTISNTVTDQPLILRPNGVGSIIFQNGSSEEILELNDVASAVNGLSITPGQAGTVGPQIGIGTGGETNVDIGFVTAGTGVLSVAGGAGTYEDNVTSDDDIPNKKYVDDQIALTGGSGTVDTVTGTVNIATVGAQNIGAASGIPANATILSVTMEVTDISDTTSTVIVGDTTNGTSSYMTAAENDPEILGTYVADTFVANGAGARQAIATVVNDSTASASAEIIITFRHN